MIVKIIKVKEVDDYEVDNFYFKYLGKLAQVVKYEKEKFTLNLPAFAGESTSEWTKEELQFIEF